ncbi:MAG: DNA primase [Bacteriovoracaceae bacterium]|nr:DNA primase [Bacteriovoracaceae bacterium]
MSSIDDLKLSLRQIPISQVVGQFISIQKKGLNYEGICPFHPDHHPSLKINDQKNLFKCFVCGKVGDSLTFAMEFKKWDFKTALTQLGSMFQLDVSGVNRPQKQELELLPYYQFLERVLALYTSYTEEHNPLEWSQFLKERSIDEDLVKNFELTFAPRNSLLVHSLSQLPKDEFDRSIAIAKELSLVKETEQGEWRDTFRNRILFPIRNHAGRLVGFGSRAVHKDQIPKYLNSAESKIFNKRKILYGFHKAKTSIRENQSIIITEGYMDTITMHKHGLGNAVASMGTAFSQDLIQMMAALKVSIYLSLDQDQAGQMAMGRIAPMFLAQKLLVKRLDLDPAKDPDEFLNRFGAMEMQQRIVQAKYWIDEKLTQISSQHTGDNRDLKLQKLREIYALTAPMGVELEATERIIEHSRLLGLNSDASFIIESYQQFLKGKDSVAAQRENWKNQQAKAPEVAIELPPALPQMIKEIENPEKMALIPWPEGANFLFKQIFTYPGIFSTNCFAEILKLVYNEPFRAFLIKLKFIFTQTAEIPGENESFHQTVMDYLEQHEELAPWKNRISDIIFSCRPQTLTERGLARASTDLLMRWKLVIWQHEIEELQLKGKAPLEKKELDLIYENIFKLKISVNELMNQLKKSPLRLTSETSAGVQDS